MHTIALLIIPQAFVAALPFWYYGFRISMGYQNQIEMRLIDVGAFAILTGCASLAWWLSRTASPNKVFQLGLITLFAPAVLLATIVAWAFVFVPHVPAHFPPWTTGTTLTTILDIIAPLTACVAGVSFVATLINVLFIRGRKG